MLRWLRVRWRQFGHQRERQSQTAALSTETEDAIYRKLGVFVVVFQWLENELVQLASFAKDPQHSGQGRHDVADLWFKDLLKETRKSVGAFLDEHGGNVPAFEDDQEAFRERLDALLDRCNELRDRRNKIVHSTYLFLESGDTLVGIVRSAMTGKGAEPDTVDFDQEVVTEASFDEAINEIGEVGFGVGQCRLELIALYRPK